MFWDAWFLSVLPCLQRVAAICLLELPLVVPSFETHALHKKTDNGTLCWTRDPYFKGHIENDILRNIHIYIKTRVLVCTAVCSPSVPSLPVRSHSDTWFA